MDLRLIESGDGGDLVKNKNDVSVIYGFQNMIYLGLFGGNVEQDTPTERNANEQAFDFWGNNLLMPNQAGIQFNSQTERALNNNALTSSGAAVIEQAVKNDLLFLNDFATVNVDVTITGVDRIEIHVIMQQPGNLQKQEFIYIWNATNKELTAEMIGSNQYTPGVVTGGIFDESFDESFA